MPKIEVPTSVTLYVQWMLHPFPNPQVPQQEKENTKWALAEAKKLLEKNSIDESNVMLAVQKNAKVLMEIHHPETQAEDGKEMWEYVISSLKESKDIVSVSILVNNEISAKIATNLTDLVNPLWHKGYQGFGSTTLIYHK